MKSLKLLVASAAVVFGMSSVAQAQSTVDMSKLTCEELLKGSGDSIEAAIWLSGYYNGLRKNTKLDLGQFKKTRTPSLRNARAAPRRPSCRPSIR